MAYDQRQRARAFRDLHIGEVLVLPNAWDAGSARIMEAAGSRAIGTTSGGISWSLGLADGQQITRDEMLNVVKRIADAVDVPVTADIESGYGIDAKAVAESVREAIGAGAVGINLEDSPGESGAALLSPEAQAVRIAAARDVATVANLDLFINARIDVYLFNVGEPSARLANVLGRAKAYAAAGADGVFVIGLADEQPIRELVRELSLPLNIGLAPGGPNVKTLASWGVARVSAGTAIAQSSFGLIKSATAEFLHHGTYDAISGGIAYADMNALFARQEVR